MGELSILRGEGITSYRDSINSGSAGVQINGPCQYFVLENMTTTNPHDDNVALAADDGDGNDAGGFTYPLPGDITDGTGPLPVSGPTGVAVV